MTKDSDTITVTELKGLLQDIHDLRPDIGVRFRVLGGMWQSAFVHLADIHENKVVLKERTSTKLFIISDLVMVVQFELEERFRAFVPNFHYTVKP